MFKLKLQFLAQPMHISIKTINKTKTTTKMTTGTLATQYIVFAAMGIPTCTKNACA